MPEEAFPLLRLQRDPSERLSSPGAIPDFITTLCKLPYLFLDETSAHFLLPILCSRNQLPMSNPSYFLCQLFQIFLENLSFHKPLQSHCSKILCVCVWVGGGGGERMCVCMREHASMCMHVCVHECECACMLTCMGVCMRTCMHVCVCVCVCGGGG